MKHFRFHMVASMAFDFLKRITAGLVDGLERWLRWGSGRDYQAIDNKAAVYISHCKT